MIELHHGDSRTVLPTVSAQIAAIITDPPYELGYAGNAWDRSGVAFDQALWRAALEIIRPGGYLLAFGGTRTYHRLTAAIEDAGWEIRDCLSWLYGSGAPKSRNVLKPAWEPIVVARRPGPATLNIEAARLPPGDDGDIARWPANVAIDEVFANELGAPSRYFYSAKASTAEREAGLDLLPLRVMRSMGTGLHSRTPIHRRNHHSTVKPLALMQWLVRLVTHPGDTVLDYFMGSGTTGCAAVREGRSFIGIERDAEYLEIARARIDHARSSIPASPRGTTDNQQ